MICAKKQFLALPNKVTSQELSQPILVGTLPRHSPKNEICTHEPDIFPRYVPHLPGVTKKVTPETQSSISFVLFLGNRYRYGAALAKQ